VLICFSAISLQILQTLEHIPSAGSERLQKMLLSITSVGKVEEVELMLVIKISFFSLHCYCVLASTESVGLKTSGNPQRRQEHLLGSVNLNFFRENPILTTKRFPLPKKTMALF
jgi:hypothetical protein